MLVPPCRPLAQMVAVTSKGVLVTWGRRHCACEGVITLSETPAVVRGAKRSATACVSKVEGQLLGQTTLGAESSTVKWVKVRLFISVADALAEESRLLAIATGRK